VQAFAAGQYTEAIAKFQLSLKESGEQDPEVIIYLNNAKQRQAFERGQGKQADRIAVSVPFSSGNANIALEMLQGIAQAQSKMTNATPIEVMIVDDENKGEVIENIGPKLAADPTILAVVGPNASDVALKAAKIYGQNRLTMITPTAFSGELEGMGNYVYRMAPRVETMVQSLGIYLSRTDKAAVCYDRNSPDNKVFQQGFRNALNEMKIEITKIECFLEEGKESELVASRLVNDKVTVLLLAPHISNIERAFAIAGAASQKGIRLLGSTTFYTSKTTEKGGIKVAGLIIPVPWIPQVDGSDIFSQQWQANVTWRTAMSYDALNVIGEALQKRQKSSREDLRSTLQSDSFAPGVTGGSQPIKFQQGNRQISTGFITVQVQKTPKGSYAFVPLKKKPL
jgi:branched-chain amino acid transport system substrate-binding protein